MASEFPGAVPEIPVRNVDEAAAYYASKLEFNVDWGDEGGDGPRWQPAARLPRLPPAVTPADDGQRAGFEPRLIITAIVHQPRNQPVMPPISR